VKLQVSSTIAKKRCNSSTKSVTTGDFVVCLALLLQVYSLVGAVLLASQPCGCLPVRGYKNALLSGCLSAWLFICRCTACLCGCLSATCLTSAPCLAACVHAAICLQVYALVGGLRLDDDLPVCKLPACLILHSVLLFCLALLLQVYSLVGVVRLGDDLHSTLELQLYQALLGECRVF
jgi:hypothetical protein